MRRFAFTIICLWIVGCSTPATRTIPTASHPISIAYPPFLEPIMGAVHICTETHPETSIIVDKRSAAAIDFTANDLTFWFGEKPEDIKYATPLTYDELVLITNSTNPNKELTLDEIRSLFAGQVQNWSAISNFQHPVSVWIYPSGNLLQSMFITELLGEDHFSSLAHVAPNPESMLQSVASDQGSIGFLPRSWLNDEVSQIQIDGDLQRSMRKPILALTKNEPQGNIQTLLVCLQTGVGQDKLLEQLSPHN